jgi:hypothetical protein
MSTPGESRAELAALTAAAAGESGELLNRLKGSPEQRRALLLDGLPGLIEYYSEGSAALAADLYDEQREAASVREVYTSELVLLDRTVKIRRAIVWAAEPLFVADDVAAGNRLAGVTQLESARPYRDTITTNTRNDPAAVGWKRVTNQCCGFCRMLAARGAVYKESTARFAAHTHCDCTAAPVFIGGAIGPEASVLQYRASRRSRSPEQREQLRQYLSEFYPD